MSCNSGDFAGLVVDASTVVGDGSPVWTLEIFQGDGFGGTLQYTQTGITLTDIGGGHIFINIAGGSGSRAYTSGSQYTFRVSTSSSTHSLTVFRNNTSFYGGGQGYIANTTFGTGGDILDVAIFTRGAVGSCGAATRLYVKHNASGANNGTSWTNAYTSLQSAIDYARGCSNIQEIWVAAGTYKPSKDKTGNASPSNPIAKTFYVNFPVDLYGGFAGTETMLSQRNITLNPTILSGDIDNNDTADPAVTAANVQGTNSNLVLHIQNVAEGVTVDGFTVTAGQFASGFVGGGIHNEGTGFPFGCTATIRNCKIQGNTGSAIFNSGNLNSFSAGSAILVVENSSISGNTGNSNAAGIHSNSNGGNTNVTVNNCTFSNITSTGVNNNGAYYEAAPSGNGTATFSKCIFSANSATSNGAAVHANGSGSGRINHTFTNCVFMNNTSGGKGGAYYANGASSGRITTAFTNCTFYNNEATNGGGAIAYTTNTSRIMLLSNCIVWQNPSEILLEGMANMTISHSLINGASAPSGATANNTLFNTDPLFVDAAGGNLRLQNCSPARNSGTSSGAPSTDFDNNARPALGGYDMGAYEAQTGSAPTTYYADADNDGFGNPSVSQQACSQPTGYVTDNTDCNDNDALEKPGQVWYKDSDNDQYAETGAASITQCLRPVGYKLATELSATSGDCNDNNAAIKPGATEICDGIDNNCNGSIDEGGICAPDYTITTTAGAVVITDVAGNGETLNVSQSSTNIRFDVSGRTYALNGGLTQNFPADVALSGASSITINTASGSDIINIAAFTSSLPSLTINGGIGDDQVNFNGDITFATNANLDVDLQNDAASPGTDQLSFTNNANLVLSGTGAAVIKVSRNITFNNGTAALETANGNLTLEANQQATATTGNFIGLAVSGATVRVNGTGILTIKGKSGNDSAFNQYGVVVQNGGLISGGTSGTATIEGSAGAGSANGNIGVYVAGTNARITSLGSHVAVTGLGGSTGASSTCRGVVLGNNGTISAGGSGNVSVNGTGGTGTGNFNAGVNISGSATTLITSSGGNVTVTGTGGGSGSGNHNYGIWQELGGTITAGGSGTVTVQGTGGPTTGNNNYGIYLDDTNTQITSGGGNVSVIGQGGGSGSSVANYGTYVHAGKITAGGAGTVSVIGTGGNTTGGRNYGVNVALTNARITSSGGAVSVTGLGGGTSMGDSYGIYIAANGLISAGGTGSVTVNGTGASASGNGNDGLYFDGPASIGSTNGDISITAQGGGSGTSAANRGLAMFNAAQIVAGGSGNVTIQANGGAGTGSGSNVGLYMQDIGTLISSSGGNVTINAVGGGTGAGSNNYGVNMITNAQVSAGGSGTVSVTGQGGSSSGSGNIGVRMVNTGTQITSSGGNITVTGIEGSGASGTGISQSTSAAITTATNGGNITLIANSMDLGSSVSTQGAGSTRLRPYTNNVQINLGSSSNTVAGPLGLSDTELDQVTTGNLIIGNANSGNITVSQPITRPASTNVQLVSGGDVLISGGVFNTGGGTLLLDPGTSPAAVKPSFNGTDVTASTLSFASDLSIAINGTTLGDGTGSTYSQLNVVGAVNLTGVDLLFTGSYVPTGSEIFTIVENDGSDAIVGTFTGLAEGATLSNFRGSGLNATISYVGGSGNDVVITVITPAAPEINIKGNGFSILNGDNSPRTADFTDFGNIDIFSTDPVVRTFTIQNIGTANLVIPVGGITKSGAPDFGIGTVFLPFTIAPGDSATFPVIIDASGNGLRTATISIQSNDSDESPYTFAVRAVGVSPEINVTGLGQNINSGDTSPSTLDDTDFGSLDVNAATLSHTFTIQNVSGSTGDLYLNAGAITVSGTHASDFSVSGITLPATVSPGQSITFVVTFNPSAIGTRTATIRIANNDLGESQYLFDVRGVGITPDYTITTIVNVLTITDVAGNGDILNITQNGGNIRFNVTGRTYSLNGAPATPFTTPADVDLLGFTNIEVNAAAGNDNINVGAFSANLPNLTINGGVGDDAVNFNGDITFATNASLDVDLQNDDATPGVDAFAVANNVNLLLSGTGTATVKVSKTILINNDGSIETQNGALTLEANQQVTSSTGYFTGIRINPGVLIRSVNGNISMAGRAGTANSFTQHGIENLGTITTTGTGNILLVGMGGPPVEDNDGVRNGGSLSATGSGDIWIRGFSTTSLASEAFANQASASVAATSGDITIEGDIIYIDPTSSVSAASNQVIVEPTTVGRAIDLGTEDSATQLGLTDAELDRITTGTLIIGNATSGTITVSQAITRPASTNVQLVSAGDVLISGGGFNTGGGTLLLDPGASPAAVKPTFNGTDVTASTLSFASDLSIAINGTTLGDGTASTYSQLKVVGAVNLTGVDLLFTGSYVPIGGNTFTIVDNDGSDAIIGTFTGLAEGATFTNFRGSGLNATISYVGGTGNDVVITVINNVVCYADTDGDGFGDPNNSMTFVGTCGTGFVSNNTDCDDNDALEKPGQIWYADVDNDGYSSGATLTQCLRPVGYKVAAELTATSGDCNDNNFAIKPSATEICDGIDNNCNGSTDEGLPTIIYYVDADNDGYGTGAGQSRCSNPGSGFATQAGDCNDANHLINPGATEVCDGVDNNCTGGIDEGLTFVTYYTDADNDGYGTGSGQALCYNPGSGFATQAGDCNDANHLINPGATEVCDGVDNNCNGSTDEGPSPYTINIIENSDTPNDGTTCSGSNVTLSTSGGTYTWSTGATSSSITVAPTITTTYTVTVTNNGCVGTASQIITVNPVPTGSVTITESSGTTPNDGTICPGNLVTLGAPAGSTYLWSTGATSSSIMVLPTMTTTYQVTVTNSNNCTAVFMTTITVTPRPSNVITIVENSGTTPNDGIICVGASISLSIPDAGPGAEYAWTNNEATRSITFSPGSTVTYLVTVTDGNNCTNIGVQTITVNPNPTPSIDVFENSGTTGSDGITCSGADVTLRASGGGTYLWSTGATSSALFIAPTITTTYTVTVTNNGCSGTASQIITVNPVPSPGITLVESSGTSANDGLTCEGGQVNLSASGGGTYLWSTGASSSEISVAPTTTTTYTVTVTSEGCNATASQVITVNPLPSPTIVITENSGTTANDGIICDGSNVTLSTSGGSYLWSTGSTASSITVAPTIVTTYTVTVTNGNGCVGVASQIITLDCGVISEVSISDPCVCQNNAQVAENGSTSNTGTFQDVVQVRANPGQTWVVININGYYEDLAGTDPIEVGTLVPEVSPGVYELLGYHVDGIGFTIEVSNGVDTLGIGNTCFYPDPVFTGLPALVAPSAAPFQVTGTVANNAAGTGTFLLDGVAQPGASPAPTVVTINPATLSVGTHTLEYSFDADTAASKDPSNPGCVQVVRQRFQVAHCGCQDVTVSLDANCQFVLPGNLVSDANCGGGTVRVMDNNPSNGNIIDCAGVWTYGLFDAFGNIICWGKVTAEDKRAPELVCAPADVTLDCYDVSYVLNNHLTIGNYGATSSPRPAASDLAKRTINNAEGVAGTGDNCQLGLIPPGLVNDNIKNLGYAYFRDNCYACGCRITLKWSDRVQYYACTDTAFTRHGYYAKIERQWVATDCNGMSSSYVQDIYFKRPALAEFVFKNESPEGKYDHVVT